MAQATRILLNDSALKAVPTPPPKSDDAALLALFTDTARLAPPNTTSAATKSATASAPAPLIDLGTFMLCPDATTYPCEPTPSPSPKGG